MWPPNISLEDMHSERIVQDVDIDIFWLNDHESSSLLQWEEIGTGS